MAKPFAMRRALLCPDLRTPYHFLRKIFNSGDLGLDQEMFGVVALMVRAGALISL